MYDENQKSSRNSCARPWMMFFHHFRRFWWVFHRFLSQTCSQKSSRDMWVLISKNWYCGWYTLVVWRWFISVCHSGCTLSYQTQAILQNWGKKTTILWRHKLFLWRHRHTLDIIRTDCPCSQEIVVYSTFSTISDINDIYVGWITVRFKRYWPSNGILKCVQIRRNCSLAPYGAFTLVLYESLLTGIFFLREALTISNNVVDCKLLIRGQ